MNTQEFIEKMKQDMELAKKMSLCKSPEEAYAAAKENGLSDDFDAFTEAMKAACNQAKSELTDEELEQIADGAWTNNANLRSFVEIGLPSLGIVSAMAAGAI